ncbi:MAG: right-handed parallel beta-helix repeat-containing protein [Phycisphaerae bacterium]|nr:right-handed parallel beta-helix repeat-containing protein [Phycisphaerae bacterium]
MMKTRLAVLAIILVVAAGCGINAETVPKTYYVSTSGDDSADGLAEKTAWRTITHAATQAQAGDTVKIKAGKYADEHVVVKAGGKKGRPVVFQALDGRPLLDGTDQTGAAFMLDSSSHVVLRGLDVENYAKGIHAQGCTHVTVEDLTFRHMGTEKETPTVKDVSLREWISLQEWIPGSSEKETPTGQGVLLANCRDSAVRNCRFHNCNIHGIYLNHGKNVVIEDCYLEVATGTPLSTEYGIYTEFSDNNIIRNCTIRNIHPLKPRAKGLHGQAIVLQLKSHHNKVLDCKSYGTRFHFVVDENGYKNEFTRCDAYDIGVRRKTTVYSNALVCRNGAYDNTFTQCRSVGVKIGISMYGYGRKGPPSALQRRNIYRNCIITDGLYPIYLEPAEHNVIRNCVIADCAYSILLRHKQTGATNIITNTIFVNIPKFVYGNPPQASFTYCNYWNNGFDAPSGTGNTSVDPLFVDPANGNYHLKSRAGRWDPKKKVFVKDTVTSPCIDAGDPKSKWKNESAPNGGRVNIGAYGNTPEASKSSEPGG